MALPLGKLTILVGAGIVGLILVKEGHMSSVSDFVSGALKFAFRQLKHDDSKPVNKPRNDYLIAQVNSLRQELQILAANRPITIVTGRGAGTSKYSIIIVVVVVGYGYVWWKGWRLPDMMFATRRSLSDTRNAIAKQLESVYSSISATRRHLSSRIEGVDKRLDEIADITATTQEEGSRFSMVEGKQDTRNEGVNWLCDYAQTIEQNGSTDRIQASPASSLRPAIEAPTNTPSRTGSLPPILQAELLSPSNSNGSPKVRRSPRNVVSASGLKEVGESINHVVANGNGTSEDKTNGSSSSGFVGRMFSGGNGSFLARSRSATNAVPQQMKSSKQQS